MADDQQPGPAEKVKGYARRARQAPNALQELRSEVADLAAQLARLEELVWAVRNDGRAGVSAIGSELENKQHHFDPVLERLDGTVAAHAAALHRAVAAPARLRAARDLRASLGPPPALRRGLSLFTLCWNHGELLPTAVASGLAVLDALPAEEQGQLLILDDASTDSTPAQAAALAEADPRVRVIRAEVNLGLALARGTLLHAAQTTHAFQLDADNEAIASGVLDLYRVAVDTGAAITYGNVVQVAPDGVVWGPMSNEPPTPALFTSNYVDTMALSDVAAYRGLGGWPTDPLLEHVDDWAALHHLIEAGLLVAFVPTLVGRYGQLPGAFHHSVPDPRIGAARVARVYDPLGRRQGPDAMAGVAAVAVHPATGPLWATPEAVALDPDLAPRPPADDPVPVPERRVLVVTSGGVRNLGDDAITVRGLERAARAFGPGTQLDVITDGPTPPPELGGATWRGPIDAAVAGLARADVDGAGDAVARAASRLGVGTGAWRPCDPSAYDAAVFLGSGLTSLWSDETIGPRALLAAALRAAGVPYACSGQGYGPFADGDDTEMVAGLVAGAVAVATRDQGSADLAAGLPGVDAGRLTVTGDDALGLAPSPPPGGPDDGGPVLAVTVRNAGYVGAAGHRGDPDLDAVRDWARAVDAVAAERGWAVRGVALNSQPPEPELATLAALRATTPLRARWHLVECGADPRHLVHHLTSGVAATAAQSYHAALFSLSAGVPTVLAAATPYYVGKAAGLAERAGLPPDLGVTDPAGLAAALDAVAAALDGRAEGDERGGPLAAAAEAADAWWSALPDRLAAARAR